MGKYNNILITFAMVVLTIMMGTLFLTYKNYEALAGVDPIIEDMYKQSSTQVGILEETKKTNELLSTCIDLLIDNNK